MYAKLIDGRLVSAPSHVCIDDAVIYHPDTATLETLGYKPVVVATAPEYDEESEMLVPEYTDGDVITQTWAVVPIPPAEPVMPTAEERIAALEMALLAMMEVL